MGLMQIPRRVDYGLRAVIYLSDQDPEKCCSIAEIAKRQGVPRKFLEKIIQDLIRGGLIKSKRGSLGGYALARPADAISFYDVIEAIEGPISVNACLDDEMGCDQLPRCTMIGVWTEIQRSVTEVLSRTTIAALRRPACKELLMASSSLSSAA
jgi:Rrf2 family protein